MTSALLRGRGYEEYLPLCRSQRRWSDRIKTIECPLFPGYLFCRLDCNSRLPVLTTPGVVAIVSAGRVPVPVPDQEIEGVRKILASGLGAQPWPFLNVGSRVILERGPLAGIEGIVIGSDKIDRLVVSVSLLQRSLAVEIHRVWARKISDPQPGPGRGVWQTRNASQLSMPAPAGDPPAALESTAY